MKLHVFPPSPNSKKVLITAGLLGLDIESNIIDLQKGEQRKAEFLALNPNGKTPVLELDSGKSLWESNAIVNYLASLKDTELWPKTEARYDIMRWQFWEACHWTPSCVPFIARSIFGNDKIDLAEATQKLEPLAAVLDGHLKTNSYLVGHTMTTADISVGAVLSLRQICQYPLDGYEHIHRWIGRLEDLEVWRKTL